MGRRKLKIGMPISEHITVLGIIDTGGKDAVYLAWDHLAWCPVACKVYGSAERAEREAAVLRAFDHPNIVRCLGMGSPDCVLMEFLDGPTLKQFIASGKAGHLSLSNALRVGIYLGSALIHMHGRGYLHLDVKPSNLIICRGHPVLFDVGTAQSSSQQQLDGTIGSDFYMSPEQCRAGEVSPASDVFGFGVTLYQALTGKLPFREGNSLDPFPQTSEDPTPLRAYLPRAPQELQALLLACMAKSAADRPELTDLLPALHEFISHGPKMWPETFNPISRPAKKSLRLVRN
jgi:serine/threonine protein kinase